MAGDSPAASPDAAIDFAAGGSAVFLEDLIQSLQTSLEIAHEAARDHHNFAIVDFDATASFRFTIEESGGAGQAGGNGSASAVQPAIPPKKKRSLISLFTPSSAGPASQQAAEDGNITIHLRLLPRRGGSKTPASSVDTPKEAAAPTVNGGSFPALPTGGDGGDGTGSDAGPFGGVPSANPFAAPAIGDATAPDGAGGAQFGDSSPASSGDGASDGAVNLFSAGAPPPPPAPTGANAAPDNPFASS